MKKFLLIFTVFLGIFLFFPSEARASSCGNGQCDGYIDYFFGCGYECEAGSRCDFGICPGDQPPDICCRPGVECPDDKPVWTWCHDADCKVLRSDEESTLCEWQWQYEYCSAADRCAPCTNGGGSEAICAGRCLDSGCATGGWYKTCCGVQGAVVEGARLSGVTGSCSGGLCSTGTCVRFNDLRSPGPICSTSYCLQYSSYGCWIVDTCGSPTTPPGEPTNTPAPPPPGGGDTSKCGPASFECPGYGYCSASACEKITWGIPWPEGNCTPCFNKGWDLGCGSGAPAKTTLSSPANGVTVTDSTTFSWYKYQTGESLSGRVSGGCGAATSGGDGQKFCWGYRCASGGYGIPLNIRTHELFISRVANLTSSQAAAKNPSHWLEPELRVVGGSETYVRGESGYSTPHTVSRANVLANSSTQRTPGTYWWFVRSCNKDGCRDSDMLSFNYDYPNPSCSNLRVSNACPAPAEGVTLNQTLSNTNFLHRAYRWSGVGDFTHFGSNNIGAEVFTVPSGEGSLQLVVNACNSNYWRVCRWTGGTGGTGRIYNANMDCSPNTATSSTCPGCNLTIGVCQKPGNPLFSSCQSTGGEFTLSWLNPANESGFRVTREDDGTLLGTFPANTTSGTFTCPDYDTHTYGIVAYRDCGAEVGGTCAGVEKVSSKDTITCSCAYDPWWQAKDGDVHFQDNLYVTVPKDNFLILEGDNGGQPGVASALYPYGQIDVYPGQVSGQDWNWQAKTNYATNKTFEYLKNRLNIDARNPLTSFDNNQIPSSPGETQVYYLRPPSSEIFLGTLSIQGRTIGSQEKILVFVDGHVELESDLVVEPGGFLALVARGNITFVSSITQAQGFFLADGEIRIPSGGGTDQVFAGQGSFIALGGVSMRRDLGPAANINPAEMFSSRFDLLLNAPAEFRYARFVFKEVAP